MTATQYPATLYHDALVQRAKSGAGKGQLDRPSASITLDNPLCGDRVTLDIELVNRRLGQIRHRVRGCLLCEAAAVTIAENCTGKSEQEARAIISAIREMMQNGTTAPTSWPILDIFSPVHESKSRRDCVLLPFTALEQVLDQIEGR